MTLVSKYWQFVKLDSTSKRSIEMVVAAQTYLQKQGFAQKVEVSDAAVVRQLWQQMRARGEADTDEGYLAEICLRCYISHQIYQVCLDLGTKFGSRNGFTCQDLLQFVLDDEVLLATQTKQQTLRAGSNRSSYQSLASTVLKTFDPAKGSLNTWVNRYVKQHPELKRFLLQHGVFLISDWALLNDTNPKQLQRILADMYRLTSVEIQQICEVLVSYHAVYREDRLEQRLMGATLSCQPPTPEQLTRIADDLQTRTSRTLSSEIVLSQLQAIAAKLRRYRIAAQGGSVSSVSFDRPDIQPIVERSQVIQEEEEEIEFIKLYQNQFLECLDRSVSQVINDFISKLQRKRSSVEQSFLTALHLFHCQGQSMTQIAPQIGLKKQFEVTRLLKLNELRADIRQRLLVMLRDRVLDTAKLFADSERLQSLDRQVELILDEQISGMIQEAESEVKNPIRNRPLRSLLARRLCRYLDSRNTKP